ncbi:MAG: hypothetical protein JWM11_4514 [Planctomycetaceae bacterium]|nr:hypothetical protein [Planctomycetaceae bacterium]
MSTPPNVVVQVKQSFTAAPERVFDAWLDPGLIGKWMFGPALREEEIVQLSVDAKPGGKFSFLVRRSGQEIDHIGEYFELDRPRRLVFSWGIKGSDSSRVTIDIVPRGTGCDLMLTHELHPDWADYASRTQAGWTKMIGVLAGLLETERFS